MLKKMLCVLILFFAFKGFAWWDSSHMVIAKIAEENLSEKAKKRCYELTAVLTPFYPETNTFVSAATWADDVANHGFFSWKWHGKSFPYDPNNFLSKVKGNLIIAGINAENSVSALNQAVKTLKNKSSTELEKALMLRYLIHIVGDLHQPLHCISLYSKDFPEGDRGGGLFLLKNDKYKNLHALWDSCLGRDYLWLKRPIDEEGEKYLEEFKKEILSQFPQKNLKAVDSLNFDGWVKESYLLGSDAYRDISPNAVDLENYMKANRKIAYERISLAGFRLAKLLNEIFEEN